MRYPLGLPKELQRPIEVARDKAEMLLLEALSNKTAHRLNEAFNFISRVFPAFAHQACEAERQGHWHGHEGREAVETFLEWQLIPHAYELARVSTFVPAPIHPPLSLAAFRHRVMEFVKESDMWRAYLAERSALGEAPLAESAAALAAAGRTPNFAPSSFIDVAGVTPMASVPDQTVASAQAADPALRSTDDTLVGSTTASRVAEYIAEVRRCTDRKNFSRRNFWQDLGYSDATEFERWQRDDPRTTPTAREKFERVLRTKPHLQGKSKP